MTAPKKPRKGKPAAPTVQVQAKSANQRMHELQADLQARIAASLAPTGTGGAA